MVGRAGTNQVGVPQKFLKSLHALLAIGVRHGVRDAGNDREMKIFTMRAIENFPEFVNEINFIAVTYERNGGSLGNINANAVGQNALDAG